MTPEQLDEIEKLLAEFWDGSIPYNPKLGVEIADRAEPLVKALREARVALDEREGDMHARIRAGYDKTVADMWRAHCAKVEQERDNARAEVERLREAARQVHAMAEAWGHSRPDAIAALAEIHKITKGMVE